MFKVSGVELTPTTIVCDGSAKELEVVELNREGTGYAAGGRAETSQKGIAFQG